MTLVAKRNHATLVEPILGSRFEIDDDCAIRYRDCRPTIAQNSLQLSLEKCPIYNQMKPTNVCKSLWTFVAVGINSLRADEVRISVARLSVACLRECLEFINSIK
jgi:hypothetical protein